MQTTPTDYLKLPLSDRIQLVEDLWDSIAEEASDTFSLSPEQKAELSRRLAAPIKPTLLPLFPGNTFAANYFSVSH